MCYLGNLWRNVELIQVIRSWNDVVFPFLWRICAIFLDFLCKTALWLNLVSKPLTWFDPQRFISSAGRYRIAGLSFPGFQTFGNFPAQKQQTLSLIQSYLTTVLPNCLMLFWSTKNDKQTQASNSFSIELCIDQEICSHPSKCPSLGQLT